jgi:hypothetical protein
MINLDWQREADGATSGAYRIRHAGERPRHPWRLDIVKDAQRPEGRGAPGSSFHRTMRGAKAAARRADRERHERDLAIGHVVLGTAASLVFAALITVNGSVAVFAVAMVALYVALRSFASLVIIKLGDAWWWARDDGTPVRPTVSDRLVTAGMHWLRSRSSAASEAEPFAAVHVLPPEPPD